MKHKLQRNTTSANASVKNPGIFLKRFLRKNSAGILFICAVIFSLQKINAQSFTSGNLAVFVAASNSVSNTTGSIIELNGTTAGQSPVTTHAIDGVTAGIALRFSGSATSTAYISNSSDGTLLCFTGGNTTNTSSNINTILPRGVGTYNSSGTFNLATTYTGSSGNQTRCATSLDNSTWYIGDQGGLYTNSSSAGSPTTNLRGVKSFGSVVYGLVASASLIPVGILSAPSGGTFTGLNGLSNGATTRQDFYLISSGSNGSSYDVLYILDATSGSVGTIFKYSLVSGSWTANGTYTTSFGGFGLAAQKNGGGANLFVTTGTGAVSANSVIKLNDVAGYNASISITTANNVTLYTTGSGTTIKGIAFAPTSLSVPSIALTDAHPSASNILQGSNDNIIGGISLSVTTTNATLTGITVTTAGTYTFGDIATNGFKFWLSPGPSSLSGATQLGTSQPAVSNGNNISVSGLSSSITSGTTAYILVTATLSASATPGNTLRIGSTAFSNIVFGSGTKTGTDPVAAGISPANDQTIIAATPSITIANGTITSGTVTQNSINNVLYRTDVTVSTTAATLNSATFNSTGTYSSSDILNLKLWYSANSTFAAGTSTLLSSLTTSLGAGAHLFTGLSQVFPVGTGYLFITTDIPCTGTPGNTINIDTINTGTLTFAAGTPTGSSFTAGGMQTITEAIPVNATFFAASGTGNSGEVNLSWTNPVPCFSEIMIVAAPAANTGIPTGDGSAYSASSTYGSGTVLGNGFVVYKGSTSPQLIESLTNGIIYSFKIFTRNGSTWSSGVEVSAAAFTTPVLTEVILPQYIQGVNGTNSSRVPYACLLTLSNLIPNASYNYFPGVVISTDAVTVNGAGNCIFPSGGGFTRSTGGSLSSAGNYGTFTADGSGSFTGWFVIEPTGNATRFIPGNNVYIRINMNDGAGGTTVVSRPTTTNSAIVLNFVASVGATNGTGLRGTSSATDKNFVVMYDNVSGTGRPVSATFVESDGTANTTANSYVSFYNSSVDGISGAYGTIIPNTNANGIRRIEQRDITTGNIVGCVATDADGIWPGGANTVNPTGGTTAQVLTPSDAPFVFTTPSVSIALTTGSNPTCSGNAVTFTATPVNGGTASYQWVKNGNNVGTNSATYTDAGTTGGSITCIMTSGLVCASPASVTSNAITLTINSFIPPVISGSISVCENQAGVVYTTQGGQINYTWTVTGGSVTAGGTTTDSTVTVSWGSAGAGHVIVNYTDGNGCTASSPIDLPVTIVPAVTPSLSISANPGNVICAGTNVTITANATNGGTSPNYQFFVNNISVQNGSSNTYLSSAFIDGDVITCTLTSNAACATSTTANSTSITIHVSTSVTPVITGSQSICSGNSTTLNAGPGYTTYLWSPGGQTTQTISVNTTGSYTVTVTNGACSGTSSAFVVTVNPLPAVSVTPSSAAICPGQSQSLTASGDPASYSWSPSTGLNATSGATVSASPSSNTVYTVTATDANNCSNSSTASISLNTVPSVSVSPTSATVVDGNSVTLTASGAVSYSWSPGGATTSTITVVPTASAIYTVTGTDGCSATATSSITVVAGNIVVLQVGNGGAESLSANGNTLHLKQFTSAGTAVGSVDIPYSGCTPLITSGNATSEGAITRSADKDFIIIAGYVTPFGGSTSLSGSTSATINRGIGRVDANGNFTLPSKTSTAFSANNIRGGVSDGNNNFWGCGAGTGIAYLGTGAPATVSSTPLTNTRVLEIFNGNLYYSTSSGATLGIWKVSGLPTSGNTAATNVITTGGAGGSSSYGFQFNPAGNVCYIADDRATSAGGIQKWTFNGTVWTLAYTLTSGVANIGARGVVVDFFGANPVIYGTSAEASANRLFAITDMGTKVLSDPTLINLATAPAGTIYRGVTFAPVNACSSTISISPVVTNSCGPNNGSVNITVSGGTAPYTFAWSNSAGTVCSTSQNLTGVGAGTYTVNVTDAFGHCFGTSTSTVLQFTAPSPVISGATSFCPGGSTILDPGTTDAGGNYVSYLWSPGGETTQTITVTTPGSYAVAVTNMNGCTSTSAVANVTLYTPPAPVISGNLGVCSGGSTMLDAGTGYSSYLWSTGATTQTITIFTPGTFTVTVTDSHGCSGTSPSVTVIQTAGISPVISGSLSYCSGSSTTLSVPSGYVSYAWTPGGQTTDNIVVTAPGIYSVTVSDGSCIGTSSVTVIENTLPGVSISPAVPATVCYGTPVSLTASGDPASYSWNPSSGLNTSSGATVSATPANTATYTVTATDANGCMNTASATVSIYQLPPVVITPPLSVLCAGNSATLLASGAVNYSWSPSTYLNTTSGSTVTSTTPASNITYTVTGTDGNNCVNTATSEIVVTPLLSAPTVVSPMQLCQNSAATPLTAIPNPGTATLLWYTSATGGTGSTTAPIPVTTSPGSTNYYVSETAGGGIQIAINGYADNRSPDLFSFVALTNIPAGTKIYFTDNGWNGVTFRGYPGTGLAGSEGLCKFRAVNSIAAGTTIVSYSTSPDYLWTYSGQISLQTGAANSFTQLSLSQAGDQVYAFMSSDSTNPIGTITKHLFVFDDTKSFEPATTSSEGAIPPGLSTSDGTAVTLLGFIDTASQHLANTGTYISVINDGQYRSADQWYQYLKDTTNNYLRINNDLTTGLPVSTFHVAASCESPRSMIEVDVVPAPDPGASSNSPVCTGSTIELSSDPFFFFIGWTWSGPNAYSSTDQNPSISNVTSANSGNYTVTVTDFNGCTGSETINVFVSNITVPGIVVNSNCSGGATGSIDITPTGGVSPYTFVWSNNATTEDISGIAAGNYSVTVTDAIGCTGSASFTVASQNNNPTISVTAVPLEICAGSSSTMTATGATIYTWTPSTGLNTTTGSTVIATPASTTTYSVTATDNTGCPSTVSVTITVDSVPVVSVSPSSVTICEGSTTTLTASGAATYSWTPSTGLSTTTGNATDASPVISTVYQVTGTNSAGCTASATSTVTVINTPSPSASSPVNYCQNATATALTATGTPGYILQWHTTPTGGTASLTAPVPSTATPGSTTYYVSQIAYSLSIAIIGWIDNGNPDVYAFVALNTIPAGTVIYFTDNGWTGTGFRGATATNGGGNEGLCKWTAVNTITAGRIILSNASNPDFIWTTSGTIPGVTSTYSVLALSQSGDQVYAFTSTASTNPLFNTAQMTHLFVLDNTGGFEPATTSATGDIPPGLVSGITANSFNLTTFTTIGIINDGQTRTVSNWYSYIGNQSNYQTSVLPSGNLNVDLGCESPRIPIVVNVDPAPSVSITPSGATTFCQGGSVSLDAGSGYLSYSWSDGTSVVGTSENYLAITGGTYTVTVTSGGGCSGTASTVVTVNPNPPSAIVTPSGPINLCSNGSDSPVILTADTTGAGAGQTLLWNDINGTDSAKISISNTSTDLILGGNTFAYNLSVQNSFGCSSISNSVTVHVISCGGMTLNLKMFIEGFYSGNYLMQNGFNGSNNVGCLNTDFVNLSTDPNDVDTVRVTLIDPSTYSQVETSRGILKTDGHLTLNFTSPTGSYYLMVQHRNTLETWSAAPVSMSSSTSYDFTDSITKAYGNNMTDIGTQFGDTPTYAMYSGDISDGGNGLGGIAGLQDGIVESADYGDMENAVYFTFTGYAEADITGDGIVESADYGLMENAVYFTRVVAHP